MAATVGLGGVRLWDGEKVVMLNPVTNRLARVGKTDTTSFMEMISKGVPYKGKKVDILVRVTVFSGKREAKVEAVCLSGEKVQFATGVNYFKGFETKKGINYIATCVSKIHPFSLYFRGLPLIHFHGLRTDRGGCRIFVSSSPKSPLSIRAFKS